MKRLLNWFGLAVSLLFSLYLVFAIPAAVSKRLNKAELLHEVNSADNLSALKEFAASRIELLCNYNAISGQLLKMALAFAFAVLALFIVNLFASRNDDR